MHNIIVLQNLEHSHIMHTCVLKRRLREHLTGDEYTDCYTRKHA